MSRETRRTEDLFKDHFKLLEDHVSQEDGNQTSDFLCEDAAAALLLRLLGERQLVLTGTG